MCTLRTLLLCVAPVLLLTVLLWPHSHDTMEAAGFAVLLLMLVCSLIASLLAKHRKTPDLRVPFFLNAAVGILFVIGGVASVTLGLWHYFTHHIAH
jgi:hypothetical protein